MKIKGFLFNTLAVILIFSFLLIDLLIVGMVIFENNEQNQKFCISIKDESIDEDVILQNSEV